MTAIDNSLDALPGYQLRRGLAATGRSAPQLAALHLTPGGASLLPLIATARDITRGALGRAPGAHRADMAPPAQLRFRSD